MSFVSDYLTPLLRGYSRSLDGSYLAQQLDFKGAQETGGDYISKVNRAHRRSVEAKYDDAFNSVK